MNDQEYRITPLGVWALEESDRRAVERGCSPDEMFGEIVDEIAEQRKREHEERISRASPAVLEEIRAGRLTWADVIRRE